MSPTHQALLGRNFSHSSTPGIGPGDLEDVSPELWEELRLDSAGAEYDKVLCTTLIALGGLAWVSVLSHLRRFSILHALNMYFLVKFPWGPWQRLPKAFQSAIIRLTCDAGSVVVLALSTTGLGFLNIWDIRWPDNSSWPLAICLGLSLGMRLPGPGRSRVQMGQRQKNLGPSYPSNLAISATVCLIF